MTAAAVQWVLLSCYSSLSRMSWKPQLSLHWLYKLNGRVSRNEALLCWFLTNIFFLLFGDVCSMLCSGCQCLSCSVAQIPSIWAMSGVHFGQSEKQLMEISVCKGKNCDVSWSSGLLEPLVLLEVYSEKPVRCAGLSERAWGGWVLLGRDESVSS